MNKELPESLDAVSQPPDSRNPECDNGEGEGNPVPSSIRYATKEQFTKAQRKTSAIHAGLFRRLSK